MVPLLHTIMPRLPTIWRPVDNCDVSVNLYTEGDSDVG